MATHNPLIGIAGLLGATFVSRPSSRSNTSYALGGENPGGKIAEASFWDTSDP